MSEQENRSGGYCNGQNKRKWWLRTQGRRAAGVKSLTSRNICKPVLVRLADGLEARSNRGELWIPPFFFKQLRG